MELVHVPAVVVVASDTGVVPPHKGCRHMDSSAVGRRNQAVVAERIVVVAVVAAAVVVVAAAAVVVVLEAVLLLDRPCESMSERQVAKPPSAVHLLGYNHQRHFLTAVDAQDVHRMDCCVDSEVQTSSSLCLLSLSLFIEGLMATSVGKSMPIKPGALLPGISRGGRAPQMALQNQR